MSMMSRVKSFLGGYRTGPTQNNVASAATFNVPDDTNLVYVTGSTTITSLLAGLSTRNREVRFIGAASCNVTFTNTNSLTTAGQMYLQGSNRQLMESDVLDLFLQSDGTWIMIQFTG